jgi:hypothetical protein
MTEPPQCKCVVSGHRQLKKNPSHTEGHTNQSITGSLTGKEVPVTAQYHVEYHSKLPNQEALASIASGGGSCIFPNQYQIAYSQCILTLAFSNAFTRSSVTSAFESNWPMSTNVE